MDLNGIERIDLNALGGRRHRYRQRSTGTDLTQVAIDMAAMPGTAQGDGQRDTVIVNGTGGGDTVSVLTSGAAVVVQGLSAQVTIDGAEPRQPTRSSSTVSAATTPSMLQRSMPARSIL